MASYQPIPPETSEISRGDDDDTQKFCRICLESDDPDHMIAPCLCRGSSRWVHRSCLDQWRLHERDRAFSQCTECHFTYHMESRLTQNEASAARWRRVKFCMLVSRDILLVTLFLQVLIGVLGWAVSVIDKDDRIPSLLDGRECFFGDRGRLDEEPTNRNLTHHMHHVVMRSFWCNHLWSAYYVCGLVLFLVALGLYGSLHMARKGCSLSRALPNDLHSLPPPRVSTPQEASRNVVAQAHDRLLGQPTTRPREQHANYRTRRYYYRRARPAPSCCPPSCWYCIEDCSDSFYVCDCCCRTTECCCETADCCCSGDTTGCCCDGCPNLDCDLGGGGSSSEDCHGIMSILMMILLVVVIILAIIGFFVGLVVAVIVFQRIIQRHIFLLHKRRLVREFVVKDLSHYDLRNYSQVGADPLTVPSAPLEKEETDDNRPPPSAPMEETGNSRPPPSAPLEQEVLESGLLRHPNKSEPVRPTLQDSDVRHLKKLKLID